MYGTYGCMAVYGCLWLCMAVYGCMAACLWAGHGMNHTSPSYTHWYLEAWESCELAVWLHGCMAVYGCMAVMAVMAVWLYMAVYGCIWVYMAVYGCMCAYVGYVD